MLFKREGGGGGRGQRFYSDGGWNKRPPWDRHKREEEKNREPMGMWSETRNEEERKGKEARKLTVGDGRGEETSR